MEQNSSLFSLSLEPITKSHLLEAAKWARILAIAGFVSLAIITANGLSTNAVFWNNGDLKTDAAFTVGSVLGMLIVMLIPLFALIFLLRFSNALRKALEADDQNFLNVSFQQLKIYFRYFASVTLILVVLMALSFLLKIAGKIA